MITTYDYIDNFKIKNKVNIVENIQVRITDDFKDECSSCSSISFYFYNKLNKEIGKIYISNKNCDIKHLHIDDNHANPKGLGYGTEFLQYVLKFIKEHKPEVEFLSGILIEEDINDTPYLPHYYIKNGFSVKLNPNTKTGYIFIQINKVELEN